MTAKNYRWVFDLPGFAEAVRRVMSERGERAADIERGTGVDKGSLHFLLTANVKRPTAEVVLSVACWAGLNVMAFVKDTDSHA